MIGARAGATNWLRRLAARALARDLAAFVVPGPEIARAGGLDLAAAGLRPVANPRHAGVLVLVGDLPDGLARAAAVAYAQMPRPRAILALGVSGVGPLPAPDVVADLRQEALADAVGELRRRVATGAFGPDTAPFDAAALRTETRYTCPMHPEIIRDRPGRCPICGMNLVPQQAVGEEPGHGADATDGGDMAMGGAALTTAQGSGPGGDAGAYTCPMHPEIVRAGPGSCPICGMDLVPSEGGHEVVSRGTTPPGPGLAVGEEPGATTRTYTCPMHPEIVRAEPGECPLCGMDLVPRVAGANAALGMTRAAPEAPSYTCPMHPEIIRDRPGSCPECGMDLVPRRDTAAAPGHGTRDAAMAGYEGHGMAATAGQRDGRPPGTYTCPMHPEIIRESPGQCPLCGMALVPREGTEGADTPDAGASGRGAGTGSGTGGDVVVYTCPMHPEVGEGQPGSCPLCGMDLIPRAAVHRDGDTATPRHEAHRQHHTGAVPGETRDTRAEARGGAAGAAQVTGGWRREDTHPASMTRPERESGVPCRAQRSAIARGTPTRREDRPPAMPRSTTRMVPVGTTGPARAIAHPAPSRAGRASPAADTRGRGTAITPPRRPATETPVWQGWRTARATWARRTTVVLAWRAWATTGTTWARWTTARTCRAASCRWSR